MIIERKMMMKVFRVWFLVLVLLHEHVFGWRIWSNTTDGPGARKGHSLVTYGTKVILFGGRGNDKNMFHLPKTFELVSRDGILEFESYDQMAVPKGSREKIALVDGDEFIEQCVDPIDTDPSRVYNNSQCQFDGENKTELHTRDNYVPVGEFFNDVWMYDLNCTRFGDGPCEDVQWQIVDPGARHGGCLLDMGNSICTHPNERHSHFAHVINDEVMVIFGGFSHFCGDYCSDAWLFFLPREGESFSNVEAGQRWVKLAEIGEESIGKRWRVSTTLIDSSILYLFGGHRLWHGFSTVNSRENRYEDTEELPKGGYLNDFWKLNLTDCKLPMNQVGTLNLNETRTYYRNQCKIQWEEIMPKKACEPVSLLPNRQLKPGYTWEQRDDELCHVTWPDERSSNGLVHHDGYLYLFGGYRTFFPYPNTRAAGSGLRTASSSGDDTYRPYPTYHFFLDDFWRFDLNTGYWEPIIVESLEKPGPRADFTFISTSDIFILFGGYRSNHHLNDFWYYNVTTSRWLRKKEFVHPIYPENCTEGEPVPAWPTIGTVVDGLNGRASKHFAVNLTRKLAPNWDGCRDRADGRKDLPWKLQWEEPSQRSGHAVTFVPEYETIMLFGGIGLKDEQLETKATTYPTETEGDLWQYRIHQCINNCSLHGDCRYGFCRCHSGYYGIDCSNTSCPGDFCYYDENTQEQVCKHCCHAPYVHTDQDVYIPDYGKLACSHEHPGRSNGICDGSGKCLCAPPFIGLDCAIKDCPNDCNGNGWCSEEYPVSRCMCNPGYTGFDCGVKECLNNCSYPNGICVDGECQCSMWPNPYNRSRPWRQFEGMDCSFLIPFAAANQIQLKVIVLIMLLTLLQVL